MFHTAGIALKHPVSSAGRAKAVILGRKEHVGDICRLLENAYSQVTLAETTYELEKSGHGKEHFRLAVMTDSFSEKLSIGLLNNVRQKFSPENMICLTRDIEEENEKTLRSAGLIFLGSYGTFLAHADNIIKHTLNNDGNPAPKPKTGQAENRKNTIDKTENYRRNNKKRPICTFSKATSHTTIRIIGLTAALAAAIFLFSNIK
jgi:N-acetylglucosaminyldiphosphoundecaprenol N-acetyl-beta-D-mannosaminyltransferase